MNKRRCLSAEVTLLFLLLAFISSATAQTAPRVARIGEVTDEYFGVTVSDPYRWMEDLEAKETVNWLKDQAEYARNYLDRLPIRNRILQELNGLNDTVAIISDVRNCGSQFFYLKRSPGEQDNKIYARDGLGGVERLVTDPEKLSSENRRYSLGDWSISWDGKYISYLVAAGGSDVGELHVVETATGKDLEERIDRTGAGPGEWLPDGKSFLYPRFPKLPENAPQADRYLKTLVYKHVLGTSPDSDRPVFGFGVNPEINLDPSLFPLIRTNPGWKYVFAATSNVLPNTEIYVAPLDALNQAVVPWRKIVSFADQVSSFDLRGDDLYLQTFKQTPRYRIVLTNITKPNVATATTVYSGGEAVVEAMTAQRDALYVQTLDGGSREIYRIDYRTKKAEPLKLPYNGSASLAATETNKDGVYFTIDSWTKSSTHFRYDPNTNSVSDTKIIPPISIDMGNVEVVNARAKSHDGTMIPLVVIHKKGLLRDGSNPTLIRGYGAYGFENTSPVFASSYLPWLERGGVVVFTGVRGGGEYGEEWHIGGFKQTKPNTWKDFIACAEYLIREKYTSPAYLAGLSYSAGGILIGRAITDRPDLFAAAIIQSGDSNPLRDETVVDGAANSAEFGTVKIENEFKALYEMDSYHHVKNGVKYPAVLFMQGINDSRVPVWQSAKMAARLQAATTSGKPILLRIDYDAGHGGVGTTQKQRNEYQADVFSFLFEQLGSRTVPIANP